MKYAILVLHLSQNTFFQPFRIYFCQQLASSSVFRLSPRCPAWDVTPQGPALPSLTARHISTSEFNGHMATTYNITSLSNYSCTPK